MWRITEAFIVSWEGQNLCYKGLVDGKEGGVLSLINKNPSNVEEFISKDRVAELSNKSERQWMGILQVYAPISAYCEEVDNINKDMLIAIMRYRAHLIALGNFYIKVLLAYSQWPTNLSQRP